MSTINDPRLSDKYACEIEEGFRLDREAWALLDLINAEWASDPLSVACFDLRIVNRAKAAISRRRELDATSFNKRLAFNKRLDLGGKN
ncbi:MAG: hypothetical protein ABJN40_13310 [Sneathiella sp.]